MKGSFDPYSGFAPAGAVPDYYNPYRQGSAAGVSMQQAQQQAQPLVPGKDTPTPGSKHGKGQKIRLQSPGGSIRKVSDPQEIQHYLQKGARRVG